jgi:hypothetical protein
VSTLRNGIGMSEGWKAFSARRSRQIESLPPEKSRHGALELTGDLPHDVDGLGFEILQMIEMIVAHRAKKGRPRRAGTATNAIID